MLVAKSLKDSNDYKTKTPEGYGIITPWPHDKIPSGFLLCDGSAVSRTLYALLFSKIGTKWGSGDGSTTFNLPNLTNRYFRGRSISSSVDPDASSRTACAPGGNTGNNIGSLQEYKTKLPTTAISTSSTGHQHTVTQYTYINKNGKSPSGSVAARSGTATSGSATIASSHSVIGTANTSEPNSVCVKYIIGYGA